MYRPAVFFLSDGQPGDDWEDSYKRIIDPTWSYHPNVLAFGFGQIDEATLRHVATVRAFIADGSMGPAEALKEFAQSLIQSIVTSGSKPAQGGGLTLCGAGRRPGLHLAARRRARTGGGNARRSGGNDDASEEWVKPASQRSPIPCPASGGDNDAVSAGQRADTTSAGQSGCRYAAYYDSPAGRTPPP